MKKAAQQRIMKNPLLVLAIIFFGIGVAIYINAGYKEGNETMSDIATTSSNDVEIQGVQNSNNNDLNNNPQPKIQRQLESKQKPQPKIQRRWWR